jgi:hypothetical protein
MSLSWEYLNYFYRIYNLLNIRNVEVR